ncbi:hypothetical protein F5B20DRAFT_576907 [Whalleya microplaca]|nr:hypothetical protein F5B20DRAFT_576907 [Whalleya microplaca]
MASRSQPTPAAQLVKKPKHYKNFQALYESDDCVPFFIDLETLGKLYNSADSRFHGVAKRRGTNPTDYASKKREDGTTLLETIAAIAYQWQIWTHTRPPVQFYTTLLIKYGIYFDMSFFEYGILGERNPTPKPVNGKTIFHKEFPWVKKVDRT